MKKGLIGPSNLYQIKEEPNPSSNPLFGLKYDEILKGLGIEEGFLSSKMVKRGFKNISRKLAISNSYSLFSPNLRGKK